MELYEKRGRRYHKVAEFVGMDNFPVGHTLVSVGDGSQARTFRIDPDRAAVLAALQECGNELAKAIHEIEHNHGAGWTKKEWALYRRTFPDRLRMLTKPSAWDVVRTIQNLILARIAK